VKDATIKPTKHNPDVSYTSAGKRANMGAVMIHFSPWDNHFRLSQEDGTADRNLDILLLTITQARELRDLLSFHLAAHASITNEPKT
jgi:hypothetical protein